MAFQVVDFAFEDELIDLFVDLPWFIYSGDLNWLPPDRYRAKAQLELSYPFYKYGHCRKFMALQSDGTPLGRVAAVVNSRATVDGEQVGYLGFYECVDDYQVAERLLDKATKYLRLRGFRHIIGPINYSTLHSYRFLVDGYDQPAFYTDIYNPAYYVEQWRRYGFADSHRYYSDINRQHLDVVAEMKPIAERLRARGFRIRPLRLNNFSEELSLLFNITNDIFAGNTLYTAVDLDEYFAIYSSYEKMLKKEDWLILEAPEAVTAGFFLCFPEPTGRYPGAYLTKMIGLVKSYRRTGVAALLVVDSLEHLISRGFTTAIAPLRIEGNLSIELGGGRYEPFKEYRLFAYAPGP